MLATSLNRNMWLLATPQGLFTNPERNAFRQPGAKQPMYRVRFRQARIHIIPTALFVADTCSAHRKHAASAPAVNMS